MTNLLLPAPMRGAIKTIRADKNLNAGIRAMTERVSDFPSETAAVLAGIGVHAPAREHLEQWMDDKWAKDAESGVASGGVPEVIIGGGLHAAIYSAVRTKLGYVQPLVIERNQRVGGTFAMSKRPSFFLNSRNRPGKLALPGEGAGLNVLPGALVQPANLSASEFQRNSDLAFVIRVTLAASARVLAGRTVTEVADNDGKRKFRVTLSDGQQILTDRVLDARGLGDPTMPDQHGEHVVSFNDFMSSMDNPFPLRGMQRVAVVGDGDSARCAIEALIGQGPGEHWSLPTLDWIDRIDWYGLGVSPTCAAWRDNNRARYKDIGSFLPRSPGKSARITPYQRQGSVVPGFECAYVNERAYDRVVMCIGYSRPSLTLPTSADDARFVAYGAGGLRSTAFQFKPGVLAIGPRASIEFNDTEVTQTQIAQVQENKTALFRLAGRTAQLAANLPGLKPEPPKKRKPKAKPTPKLDVSISFDGYSRRFARASTSADMMRLYEQMIRSNR